MHQTFAFKQRSSVLILSQLFLMDGINSSYTLISSDPLKVLPNTKLFLFSVSHRYLFLTLSAFNKFGWNVTNDDSLSFQFNKATVCGEGVDVFFDLQQDKVTRYNSQLLGNTIVFEMDDFLLRWLAKAALSFWSMSGQNNRWFTQNSSTRIFLFG